MIDFQISDKPFNEDKIAEILTHYDDYFIPKISDRKNIVEYARKLSSNATFILAKNKRKIVGFTAFYFNPVPKTTYLTLIATDRNLQGTGIGKSMIYKLIEFCTTHNSAGILLEMRANNLKLFNFYDSLGFEVKEKFSSSLNGETRYHMYLPITK
ncbi:Acetyltransferase (GNAT) domain-containing protein [Tangfeifania diversioriginum]|uniref:Acetyltransferase (GNAT) domain-containing protein n=1 Tax=Tangfeifania diversioriginum TaxID=1168035 RepID=A0A1M6LRM2_9BACT|nr:GNAT family N-acetyltransferase [Tangfeifania diversioriginum]SHJ73762.1 Acetyltransferase (GNAT) domain-containing protein [Tangfeifania diversioriginum]